MHGHDRWCRYGLIGALALALTSALPAASSAAETAVECRLLYEIADGIYVDVGREAGLERGASAVLQRGGRQLLRVEVGSVSTGSAFLRFLGPRPAGFPKAGERVTLLVSQLAPSGGAAPRTPSRTLKDRAVEDDPAAALDPAQIEGPPIDDPNKPAAPEAGPPPPPRPFVPLLAPLTRDSAAFTEAFNIFQGQISLRELYQLTPGEDLDYTISHLRSSGTLQRIQATPWTFEWDLDLSYRDGEALEDVNEFRWFRFELYRAAFYRRFDDGSTARLGRFLPRELPAVGYLDGGQAEWVIDDNLRLGGMVGLKPRRQDIDFSFQEQVSATYATVDFGGEAWSYTGTIGLLGSLYKGKIDRVAILAEQTAQIEKLAVLSSSELDFDVGSSEVNEGTRLTRWDLLLSYPLYSHTTLRAGLDRFESPDTAAERDVVDDVILEDVEFFDRGFWRYWVGASHELPWNLRLSEEIALTDASQDDWTLRWLLSLTRSGLPFLAPTSSLTLTVYNFEGEEDGYGGRLSGYIPVGGHSLSLHPELAFRFLESDLEDEPFFVSDVSLRAFWALNRSWSFSAGAGYAFTDEVQRILFDVGLTFRW